MSLYKHVDPCRFYRYLCFKSYTRKGEKNFSNRNHDFGGTELRPIGPIPSANLVLNGISDLFVLASTLKRFTIVMYEIKKTATCHI